MSTLTVLSGVERPVLWVMVGAREAEGSQPLLLGAEGLLNMVFVEGFMLRNLPGKRNPFENNFLC